jgi:hypothetical protein
MLIAAHTHRAAQGFLCGDKKIEKSEKSRPLISLGLFRGLVVVRIVGFSTVRYEWCNGWGCPSLKIFPLY